MTDPSKQLCHQQQLGCRREEQKRGRHCWIHGVRGCWGNTSTYIAYSCLDLDKCQSDKYSGVPDAIVMSVYHPFSSPWIM